MAPSTLKALFCTNHYPIVVVVDDLEAFVDFFNRIMKFGGYKLYRKVLELLLYCK